MLQTLENVNLDHVTSIEDTIGLVISCFDEMEREAAKGLFMSRRRRLQEAIQEVDKVYARMDALVIGI